MLTCSTSFRLEFLSPRLRGMHFSSTVPFIAVILPTHTAECHRIIGKGSHSWRMVTVVWLVAPEQYNMVTWVGWHPMIFASLMPNTLFKGDNQVLNALRWLHIDWLQYWGVPISFGTAIYHTRHSQLKLMVTFSLLLLWIDCNPEKTFVIFPTRCMFSSKQIFSCLDFLKSSEN